LDLENLALIVLTSLTSVVTSHASSAFSVCISTKAITFLVFWHPKKYHVLFHNNCSSVVALSFTSTSK
jgi:hypothetical protein